MSDAASSGNLAKSAYLSYRMRITRMDAQEALNRWYNIMTDDDRAQWLKVYEDILDYNKYAESDS